MEETENLRRVSGALGAKSDGLEKMLSKLECTASDVLDEQERVSFAIFLAFFYCRTPAFHKEQVVLAEKMYRAWIKANHPTSEVTTQRFEEMAKETGETMDPEAAAEFFKVVRDDEYEVDVPRQHIIRLMGDTALHLAKVLVTLDWSFLVAPLTLSSSRRTRRL